MENSVFIVQFSSRKDGNCYKIASKLEAIYKGSADVHVFRFSEHSIRPCGNCRYECLNREKCPHGEDSENGLLEGICGSDLTVFIIPNYCDYPCANFFIFNERSNGWFQGHPQRLERYLNVPKGFIIVSGSSSANFREILQQHCSTEPEPLVLCTKAYGKHSMDANLMDSPQAREALDRYAANLQSP